MPPVTPGTWQTFSYAQVDGFVLDCRSQRDPENDPDGPEKSMLDGNNLGATGQLQWLKDGLLSSTARWKVITMQPASVTVRAGKAARFSVAASGSTPLSYQWRKNGSGPLWCDFREIALAA